MTTQLDLTTFSEKTIDLAESTKDFRAWNNVILSWEITYVGYSRGDDGPLGYIDFHVYVDIQEAIVKINKPKRRKKGKGPGYRLTVTQNIAFEGKEWETYLVYEESFEKQNLRKSFDAFQRELLNIQTWVEIAESRARIIPMQNDVFECPFCGWVTDIWADDIMCPGCGKRFWSERMWDTESTLPIEMC